eukprot:14021975-Heterocapsa_arctica.AAC.1
MSGRSMLCLVHREFEPNGLNFETDTLQDIYDLKMEPCNMEGLQVYCSQLDALMLRCTGEQPSPASMTCRFYRQ